MATDVLEKDDPACEKELLGLAKTNNSKEVIDMCSKKLSVLDNRLFAGQSDVITVLKLDFNNLSSLPHDFVHLLPNLKVLCANGNELTQLPCDIGSLTSLTDLELKDNQLTCLPDSVQYLVNLIRLQLTGNQLSSLPEDFGEMKSLEELAVDENKLTAFPPTFALLDKLRILEAGFNKLQTLPRYLGSMRSLTHLSISNNKVETLPESFSELEQLVVVDISNNNMKCLPEDFSSQGTLEKLFADDNQLFLLPDWVGHLPNVTVLSFQQNVIAGDCFPEDFGKVCKKLRHLDLRGSNITSLPKSFGELESLQWAHFGSCLDELERRHDLVNGNWLTSLPASFPQLTQLTMLRLDENHLNYLPESFGCLCNLDYLDLGQNLLYDLPESFGKLSKLRVCLLSLNNIQLLPSSFGQLAALEELRLNCNQLAELPDSFGQLTQLQILDLFGNKLTELPPFLNKFEKLLMLDLDMNPLKMRKKLVPYIYKSKEHRPCPEHLQHTWRGRVMAVYEEPQKPVRLEKEEESDEEMADAPVNLYGSEDLPYNFRFAHSPNISVLRACNTTSSSCSGDREDSDGEERSHSEYGSCAEVESDQEENADDNYEILEDGWSSNPVDESNALPSYEPVAPDEDNWEDDTDETSQSKYHPFHSASVHSKNHPSSAFLQLPADLHVPSIPDYRNDPACKMPEPVEGQFSDDDVGNDTFCECGDTTPPVVSQDSVSLTPWAPSDLHAPEISRQNCRPFCENHELVVGQFLHAESWC